MTKTKLRKIFTLIFLCTFTIFFIVSFSFFTKEFFFKNKTTQKKNSVEKKEQKKEYQLSMIMGGDALYHTGAYQDGKQSDGSYNYDDQLSYIAPIVSKYDLAYYNQETILGGTELGLSSYPTFNSPQEVGDAFVKAGFNLVSLANNHTLDKGTKAVLNSAKYWSKQSNVMTAGSYGSHEDKQRSHIGEKNGIKYAFFAYTVTTNGIKVPTGKEYLVNVYSDEKVKNDVEAVKSQVDVILVSMHWGEEYTHTPTTEQRRIAQYLADLGVSVVIGSHPHVIQPIEHIGDTVVIYSLGNFISAQIGIERRVGMLATLNIKKTVENGNTTVAITDVGGDLVYTYHTNDFKKFRIIPFSQLNNSLLSNYQSIQAKYEAIINKNDNTITVGNITS